MSFIAPLIQLEKKLASFEPTNSPFGLSLLTFLSAENAKSLPHAHLNKKKKPHTPALFQEIHQEKLTS